MSFYLLIAPIIPLLLLFALHTKSRISRFTLKALSIWLFIAILNGVFLEYDCIFIDFAFGPCDILTAIWAESLTLVAIINFLFGSFVFPGILATLGLYELYLRKFKKKIADN